MFNMLTRGHDGMADAWVILAEELPFPTSTYVEVYGALLAAWVGSLFYLFVYLRVRRFGLRALLVLTLGFSADVLLHLWVAAHFNRTYEDQGFEYGFLPMPAWEIIALSIVWLSASLAFSTWIWVMDRGPDESKDASTLPTWCAEMAVIGACFGHAVTTGILFTMSMVKIM
ncbi:MAG: hypothetical protein M5U26_10670 [Planctomycetota bacterium]|nr:hypothetical protein [Planctomycetota bacterium]